MISDEEQQYHDQQESKRKEGDIEREETVKEFRKSTVEGKWKDVIDMCEADISLCTIIIHKSRGTVLHVAVNEGNEEAVRKLVDRIIKHDDHKVDALKLKDERGDTPLHLAATRGLKNICEFIIGKNQERKELIRVFNNEGETPIFQAALSWRKKTFLYMCPLIPDSQYENFDYIYKFLIRSDGDSILHCAIRREFFDLAIILMNKFPKLNDTTNKEGFTPLKLLATRPAAFKSGSNLTWWKNILYNCVLAETLNVEKAEELYKKEDKQPQKQFPRNYDTCNRFYRILFDLFLYCATLPILLFHTVRGVGFRCISGKQDVIESAPGKQGIKEKDLEKMPESNYHYNVPENYVTCFQTIKLAYVNALGLSGVGVEDIWKMKQKHIWSRQLLSELMKTPYESYTGSGGKPSESYAESGSPPGSNENDQTDFISVYNPLLNKSDQTDSSSAHNPPLDESDKKDSISAFTKALTALTEKGTKPLNIDGEETVILVAARNGIVEMVNEIISKIPSAIYETNSKKKNVLLVAVENRQPPVVELLKNRFENDGKTLVFKNLLLGVDDQENTVLHLAAVQASKGWMISGTALQLIWHIKWFQYIKGLVPEHFTYRSNKDDQTAGEIFRSSHTGLVDKASEWIKDTSESCSVVAALLAGVSFATSTTVPGGVDTDTGKPALEGRPAFESFAMCSIFGLCFSVTALVMFLSILTSRKEIKDFRVNLPLKVLLGLSSLFISITALFATFCSAHFFVIDNKFKQILILIYAVTCLPVTLYAVAQFPLYIDLMKAIATKVPRARDKGGDL